MVPLKIAIHLPSPPSPNVKEKTEEFFKKMGIFPNKMEVFSEKTGEYFIEYEYSKPKRERSDL